MKPAFGWDDLGYTGVAAPRNGLGHIAFEVLVERFRKVRRTVRKLTSKSSSVGLKIGIPLVANGSSSGESSSPSSSATAGGGFVEDPA